MLPIGEKTPIFWPGGSLMTIRDSMSNSARPTPASLREPACSDAVASGRARGRALPLFAG